MISEATGQKVSSLVSAGKDRVDQDKPIQDLGLDSSTAMEVKNFVRKAFDAIIRTSEILDEHSLTALSSKVASRSEMLRKKLGNPPKGTKSDGESASRLAPPRALANAVYYSLKEGSLPALPRSLSPRPNLHEKGYIMAIRQFWRNSLSIPTTSF